MPTLRSFAPVRDELSTLAEAPAIRSSTEFAEQLAELAKAKPNGQVLGNREGITTAKVVALLSRVAPTLRTSLSAAVHNDGREVCSVGGITLIKSPCFTHDFSSFVKNAGVFEGFAFDETLDDETAHGKAVERAHRYLICRGVEWGFQYHNFYGYWELSTEEPLINGRPHYVHNTMYGGYAHLFHCVDPNYRVPRWVIGSAPGNENGWAFCESDAPTPQEVATKWTSWDGFEWHSCTRLRYVTTEGALDDQPDDDDAEWADGIGRTRFSEDEADPSGVEVEGQGEVAVAVGVPVAEAEVVGSVVHSGEAIIMSGQAVLAS